LQGFDRLFGAFFTNVESSTNRPTSTSQMIGNQPLITLWFIGLLLLIDLFANLENLICETSESVAIPGLVLSLGVENIDVI
jgi:hypothetical protein